METSRSLAKRPSSQISPELGGEVKVSTSEISFMISSWPAIG